ncbi:MAG: molybdate ABC transporter permease subunit [Deltaproteobacteria bacterium]
MTTTILETVWQPLRLSIQVSLISTILVALTGTVLGYMLSRKDFFAKDVIDAIITLPMVLPPTVTGYYLILILGRHGLLGKIIYNWTGWAVAFTWQAAAVASFVVSFPLMAKTARAAVDSVNSELEKASLLLGKGEIETVLKVTLPLAWRGLLAGIVLSFARGIGEFGATLMLAGNIPGKTATMPIAIYSATQSGEYSLANYLVIILTILSLSVIYATIRLSKRD